MNATERSERPPSPFFLASATGSAFLLLISVAFSTTAVYHPGVFDVVSHLGPGTAVSTADYEACARTMFATPEPQTTSQICAAAMKASHSDFRPGILLCFATLLLLSAAQYWFGPAWRIRRRRLRPIDAETFPEVHEELDRMAAHTLGGDRVRFLLDIVNPAVDGLAFGRVGRRHVVLSRGMLALFERDRSQFWAVVLHELAHVRNRDLDITAATLALWRSYFFVILVPGLLATLNGVLTDHPPVPNQVQVSFLSGAGTSWLLAAQILGLTGLSWLTRYSVLRARELQADARVLIWQGTPVSLRRLFDVAPAPRRRSLTALRRRTHPHLKARLAALTDPGPLLSQGVGFSFALGACFSLDLDPATSLTALVRQDHFYWPAETFVIVLVLALGIRALRAAAYADANGRTDAVRARLGLALGLPAGWMLSPSRLTDHSMTPFPFSLQLAGLLALALAGWLLGLWVEWVAARWAPRVRAAARPARAAVAPVALIALVVLLSARTVYVTQSDMIVAHMTRVPPVSNPLKLVVGVTQMVLVEHFSNGVWLPVAFVLLMAPLLVRTKGQDSAGIPQHPVRRAGCLSSLAFVGVWFLATILVAIAVGAVDRITLGSAGADPLSAIGAGFSATMAYRARRSPLTRGVFAACVAGGLLLALMEAASSRAGMTLGWSDAMYLLGHFLEASVLAGLIASWLSRHRASAVSPIGTRRSG